MNSDRKLKEQLHLSNAGIYSVEVKVLFGLRCLRFGSSVPIQYEHSMANYSSVVYTEDCLQTRV